jgi:hypothetical protein
MAIKINLLHRLEFSLNIKFKRLDVPLPFYVRDEKLSLKFRILLIKSDCGTLVPRTNDENVMKLGFVFK